MRVAVQKQCVPFFHHPVDLRLGEGLRQRRRGGKRVNNIAD